MYIQALQMSIVKQKKLVLPAELTNWMIVHFIIPLSYVLLMMLHQMTGQKSALLVFTIVIMVEDFKKTHLVSTNI